MRLLVIEDYLPLRLALVKGLVDAGYSVDAAANGRDGLWQASSGAHDVVILDLMLPEKNGETVLKELRQKGVNSHVLVLTAMDGVGKCVDMLNDGADDFLAKPFHFSELLARVRALVRRKYESKNPVIQVGDLEVDTVRKEARRAGIPIELTAKEFALLEFLAMRSGEVVSRTSIWEHVYDLHSDSHSNVIDVYISYLRKKIDREDLPKLIHTRRGHGYLLAEAS